MAFLDVKNCTKNFGGLLAVNNVTFSVKEGELLGLIGPNGAGKTTMFNMISGVYKPTNGQIVYRERYHIHALNTHRICHIGIARTYQVVKPFLNMTILKNVLVGAYFGTRRTLKRDATKIAQEVLEFTGLWDRRDEMAGSLNVPSRKRLEIARALATKPDLLLLDEVMAGLNPAETKKTMDLVKQIQGRGVTIIMIEHVMQAVMGLSERIIVLNYGEIIAEGIPKEVASNPEVIKAYLGD
jgi:branched-chain amino acid transport system ATP-binding protein